MACFPPNVFRSIFGESTLTHCFVKPLVLLPRIMSLGFHERTIQLRPLFIHLGVWNKCPSTAPLNEISNSSGMPPDASASDCQKHLAYLNTFPFQSTLCWILWEEIHSEILSSPVQTPCLDCGQKMPLKSLPVVRVHQCTQALHPSKIKGAEKEDCCDETDETLCRLPPTIRVQQGHSRRFQCMLP